MNSGQYLDSIMDYMPLIIILVIWEGIWKMAGMWRAGRNNELGWFICIALINTLGILPIIYLIIKKQKS